MRVTRPATSTTPAKVFGPKESEAIFENKWIHRINEHILKLPLWQHSGGGLADGPMLELIQWSSHAFDLIVAFESQAKALQFHLDPKYCPRVPDPNDLADQAGWMRFTVNCVIKAHSDRPVRRSAPCVNAFNDLIDKIVMGELEGIWFTDEELVETYMEMARDLRDVKEAQDGFQKSLEQYREEMTHQTSS